MEHKEFLTSIVSPGNIGNILEYTVYKPAPQIITVMANPNSAAAQIIPGPYIVYNRLNQPALLGQRPKLAPLPQQVPLPQGGPAQNL